MTQLKKCPCGKTPTRLHLYDVGQGWKWVQAYGDCCGEWHIEFKGNYSDPSKDGGELFDLAIEAWNEAPRSV